MKPITVEQYSKLKHAESLLADVQVELAQEDDHHKYCRVEQDRWRSLFSLRLSLAREMHSFTIVRDNEQL